MTPQVLLLQPDPARLSFLTGLLEENGLAVRGVTEVSRALEVLAFEKPALVITEIAFPSVAGQEVLEAIRHQNPDPLIIIYTALPERRVGADRRLGDVFEFIPDTGSTVEILAHVRRALAFYAEKSSTVALEHDNQERLRNKLEWLIWKEKIKLADRISAEKTLINNIKHSLSQGMGLGGMTTMIDLLAMAAKREGNEVRLPADRFDQLVAGSESARNWFDSLESVINVFGTRFAATTQDSEFLQHTLEESLGRIEPFRSIKEQEIRIGRICHLPVLADPKAFGICVRELLTNAFKYSPPGSQVDVTTYRSSNKVSLVFVNDVLETEGRECGIPHSMENVVFEPFFRLDNTYDERFRAEELGMGIGLTVVQNAMTQCGGTAYLYEVLDHTSDAIPRRRVAGELILEVPQA